MCLYKLKPRRQCVIERMPQVKLLNSMGVREGMPVSIMSIQPLGGPIVIRIGNRNVAIAKDLAEQIFVKEVS